LIEAVTFTDETVCSPVLVSPYAGIFWSEWLTVLTKRSIKEKQGT